MTRAFILSLLAVSLLAAGCGGLRPASPAPTPPDLTQPTPADAEPEETLPPENMPPAGAVPPDLFRQMVQEAAAVGGVSLADVTVERADAVVWNDGSLGCPQAGEMYTQALVPGYWVVLRAAGREFDFRATERGSFKLCAPGQGRPPLDR